MVINMLFPKLIRYWIHRHPAFVTKLIRDHVRKFCPESEVPVYTKGGFRMFVSPHDYASFEIYFRGLYDQQMTAFFQAHLFGGNVCWDVGTERGWFTLLMANLVGPEGRVDSFEAFPSNFLKLKNNIETNKFEWVKANNVAISDTTGSMFFVPPSNKVTHNIGYLQDCGGVGYLTQHATPESIKVPTISLDDYVESNPVNRLDFIKMDIEGAEYAALLGAQKSIRKFRPKMAIEYNRETALRAGSAIEEIDGLIDEYGYDRFTFYGKLEKLRLEDYKDLPDNYVVFNVYCFPR